MRMASNHVSSNWMMLKRLFLSSDMMRRLFFSLFLAGNVENVTLRGMCGHNDSFATFRGGAPAWWHRIPRSRQCFPPRIWWIRWFIISSFAFLWLRSEVRDRSTLHRPATRPIWITRQSICKLTNGCKRREIFSQLLQSLGKNCNFTQWFWFNLVSKRSHFSKKNKKKLSLGSEILGWKLSPVAFPNLS